MRTFDPPRVAGPSGRPSASLNILWWILIIGLVLWQVGFFSRGSAGRRLVPLVAA